MVAATQSNAQACTLKDPQPTVHLVPLPATQVKRWASVPQVMQ